MLEFQLGVEMAMICGLFEEEALARVKACHRGGEGHFWAPDEGFVW